MLKEGALRIRRWRRQCGRHGLCRLVGRARRRQRHFCRRALRRSLQTRQGEGKVSPGGGVAARAHTHTHAPLSPALRAPAHAPLRAPTSEPMREPPWPAAAPILSAELGWADAQAKSAPGLFADDASVRYRPGASEDEPHAGRSESLKPPGTQRVAETPSESLPPVLALHAGPSRAVANRRGQVLLPTATSKRSTRRGRGRAQTRADARTSRRLRHRSLVVRHSGPLSGCARAHSGPRGGAASSRQCVHAVSCGCGPQNRQHSPPAGAAGVGTAHCGRSSRTRTRRPRAV